MFTVKMVPKLVFGIFCVSVTMVMTQSMSTQNPDASTHHPHVSHVTQHGHHGHHFTGVTEPAEVKRIRFFYQPVSHQMIIMTEKNCYIRDLTDSEKATIHTDDGMRAAEMRLLASLTFASFTEVRKAQLDSRTQHVCGAAEHFYLENTA